MPFCSCPHCGRTNIPFELGEAENVVQCARCDGLFTPLGGKVQPPAAFVECQLVEEGELVAHAATPLSIAPQAVLSERRDSPLLAKACRLLSEGETIWALVPGRTLDRVSQIETKGQSSSFGVGFSPLDGVGIGVGSGRMSARSKMTHSMELQGGLLTHYLIITNWQVIFWMRGILSEWLGAGPQADHIDISILRGIERQQQRGTTTLIFHFELGHKYFATRSEWAERVQNVVRRLIQGGSRR